MTFRRTHDDDDDDDGPISSPACVLQPHKEKEPLLSAATSTIDTHTTLHYTAGGTLV